VIAKIFDVAGFLERDLAQRDDDSFDKVSVYVAIMIAF
jgi:hypothetical protein